MPKEVYHAYGYAPPRERFGRGRLTLAAGSIGADYDRIVNPTAKVGQATGHQERDSRTRRDPGYSC